MQDPFQNFCPRCHHRLGLPQLHGFYWLSPPAQFRGGALGVEYFKIYCLVFENVFHKVGNPLAACCFQLSDWRQWQDSWQNLLSACSRFVFAIIKRNPLRP